MKILHLNSFTLKQITNLCSFRPTIKTRKTGVDLTIMDKKIEQRCWVILYMLMQNNVRTRHFIMISESCK